MAWIREPTLTLVAVLKMMRRSGIFGIHPPIALFRILFVVWAGLSGAVGYC